jgi:hypothetical protein
MNRPVTSHEAAIVEWLVDNASVGDVAAYRLRPVAGLSVVGGCACGCRSLDFQLNKAGAKMIADAIAVYPDGQKAGLILWGRDGEIVSLEVYDLHPEASHRMPEIAHLRNWEELYRS